MTSRPSSQHKEQLSLPETHSAGGHCSPWPSPAGGGPGSVPLAPSLCLAGRRDRSLLCWLL